MFYCWLAKLSSKFVGRVPVGVLEFQISKSSDRNNCACLWARSLALEIVRYAQQKKRKLGIVWFGLGLVPPHAKLILL
jgi:hypothetical protein